MREFLRSPKRASDLLRNGKKILVTSNGTPLFTAVPEVHNPEGATMQDFTHIRIQGNHDTTLSKQIDNIVYES